MTPREQCQHNRKDLAMSGRKIKQASLGATIYNIYSKISHQSSKSTSSKKSRNKRDIISTPPYSEFPATTSTFSGLVLMLLFSILFCGNTFAASSISISLSGSVDLNLMGGNAEGVFGKSTAATANVETNNYTGYTFTITGGNNTGALIGANDQNHTIPSITSPLTESEFNTSTYNNKWGFLPSKLNSTTNTKYQPAPTTTGTATIDATEKSNVGDPNSYTLALAARVDSDTPNDHYTGAFTLAATGNPTEYHIAYADLTTTIPAQQSGTTTTGSVSLSSEYPSKYGYTFLGWCSVPTTDNTCSGTVYQPGGNYSTFDTTSSNPITLYAMWRPNYGTFDSAFAISGASKVNGYYPMQSMSETICNNVTIGTTGTLIDTRDNRTYEVIKYADNNCWMHQNLELTFYTGTDGKGYAENSTTTANSVTNGKTTLTSSDTDITSGSSVNISDFKATQNAAPGSSTGAWADNGSDGGHSFSWVAYDLAQAYAIPTGTQNEYGQNQYTTSANGAPSQRGGNLYNWTMATLGSGVSITTDGQNAPNSICPKGWQLPVNSGDKSFYNLLDAYYTGTIGEGDPRTNSTTANPSALTIQQNLMRTDPLDFVVSGLYDRSKGTIDNRTAEGSFWSVTANTSTHARLLASFSTGFYSQGAGYRGFGRAVRCVAR